MLHIVLEKRIRKTSENIYKNMELIYAEEDEC